MNISTARQLDLLNSQVQRHPSKLPRIAKAPLKQIAAFVYASATEHRSNPPQKPLQELALNRHHLVVLARNGISTYEDLISCLLGGGRCTRHAYLLAVITAARLLNLVSESPPDHVADATLKQLDNRFWRWLEEEPLPAALRNSGFLMVTKTRSGFIRYWGFSQSDRLKEALTLRCNQGSLDSIVSILDLIHLQRLRATANLCVDC